MATGYMMTASRPKEIPLSEAIESVHKVLKYNPYSADMRANLIKLELENKNLAAAKVEFAELKKLVPENSLVKTLSAAGL